jgi:hypothetical protein
MSNQFIIQWKSRMNGRAGRGSKVFSREDAERLAQELNEDYPEIDHEVVPAPPENPAADAASPSSEPSPSTLPENVTVVTE